MKSVFLTICSLMLSGCYAYSSFQTAKTVEKGKWQGTASYSSNSFSNSGESDRINGAIEAQLRAGLSDKSDIGFRYAYIDVDNASEDYGMIAIEPKFMLVKDRFSLIAPLGMYVGQYVNEDESFHFSPGFIATYPFNKNFDASVASRYMIFFDSDSDNLVALNLGFGVSTDIEKWAIRPEIGYLFNPGNDGHYFQYGVGLSFNP